MLRRAALMQRGTQNSPAKLPEACCKSCLKIAKSGKASQPSKSPLVFCTCAAKVALACQAKKVSTGQAERMLVLLLSQQEDFQKLALATLALQINAHAVMQKAVLQHS